MASTGLKIAIGVVIGVSLTGALLSHVSAPSQPRASTGQVNDVTAEPAASQEEAPAPQETSEHEAVQSDESDGAAPDSEQVAEAKRAVADIIGLNGYHCIKITNVQDASSGVYDVTCITDHHGHQATFMVNSRTNDVAEL